MTSRSPRVGEVWLAYVEFSDHPGVGKVRPVVVVGVSESACVAVAAKVTSRDLSADGSGRCLPIMGWESCGLRRPSYVRLDQRFELPFSDLLRGEPLGELPAAYVRLISDSLSGLA